MMAAISHSGADVYGSVEEVPDESEGGGYCAYVEEVPRRRCTQGRQLWKKPAKT